MAYFDRFPLVSVYEFGTHSLPIVDITRRTGIPEIVKNDPAFYIEHSIKDGETPIILADRIYDDADLYWIILVFNDIYNIDTDWPLSYAALEKYTSRAYDDKYAIRHYESLSSNLIVDSDWPSYDRISITHHEYETRINESRRNIKIPIPDAISQLVREHRRLIQE